jgi:hypothetical protein
MGRTLLIGTLASMSRIAACTAPANAIGSPAVRTVMKALRMMLPDTRCHWLCGT